MKMALSFMKMAKLDEGAVLDGNGDGCCYLMKMAMH